MVELLGSFVRLEPLAEPHRERLRVAAQDERIWEFNVSTAFGPAFDGWFDAALRETVSRIPFAVVRLADESVVGSSSFLDHSPMHRRVEIGHTWYHPSVWRSGVNAECKLLLLTHAFGPMELNRVAFQVDAINVRSRGAVSKLGAVREGILRRHAITYSGRKRDTVVYSVTSDEWPAVCERLKTRLAATPR